MNTTNQFCQDILHLSGRHAKARVNLVLALASYKASSVTDLSRSPLYQYQYSSIADAITHLASTPEELLDVEHEIAKQVSSAYCQNQENPIVLQTDKTGLKKPHSKTLAGRHIIAIPNHKGPGRALDIGVEYSFVNIYAWPANWSLPISIRRVEKTQTASELAVIQITDLLTDEELELHIKELIINTLDSGYATATYIDGVKSISNLVSIIRFRHGSKAYDRPTEEEQEQAKKAKIYGKKYYLIAQSDIKQYKSHPKTKLPYNVERDSITEKPPDEDIILDRVMNNGRVIKVRVRTWSGLILRTKKGVKMDDKPFTMACVQVRDASTGKLVFQRPLFLSVFGEKRNALSAEQIYDHYGKRYGIEPLFRFVKQNMHMQTYQACSDQNLDNWMYIIMLSVWLLFSIRDDAVNEPKKWQKYNDLEKKTTKGVTLTISQAFKAAQTYFSTFDWTVFAPQKFKPGPGRVKGFSIGKRKTHPYTKKITSATKSSKKVKEAPT